jgi:hypothetical protein
MQALDSLPDHIGECLLKGGIDVLTRALKVVIAVLVISAMLAGVAVAQTCTVNGNKQGAKQSIKVCGNNNKVVVKNVVKNNKHKQVKKPAAKKKSKFGTIAGVTILLKESSTTTGSVVNTTCAGTVQSVECSRSIETSASIDTSCTALANVHLRLLKPKGKGFERVSLATQSGKCGAFTFKNVKPGDYVLKVWSKTADFTGTRPIKVHVDAGGSVKLRLEFKTKAAGTTTAKSVCKRAG